MPRERLGLLSALLKAVDEGDLANLNRLTPGEIAPKLAHHYRRPLSGRQLSQAFWYAKRKGFLAAEDREGALALVLTYKGRERLLSIRRQGLVPAKPSEWDGKWRLVTFDIPEKRRFARDTFRNGLKKMGFLKLESGLWLFPFECRHELDVLAEALLVRPHVRLFVVEHFDDEETWRGRFGL